MSSRSDDIASASRWLDNLNSALRVELPHWVYIGRALLALFITGWLALRFNLQSPSTAMLTTVLILNRQSGMIIAKSFYRTIGTVIGAIVSVLLIALYAQHSELFLLGFSSWIALCAGGAGFMRNFKSYAFVLSGYTTTFITLSSYQHPEMVFNDAVARCSEVMLGIIVTTVVHEVVFPVRMGKSLWAQAQSQFEMLFGFFNRVRPGDIDNRSFIKDQVDAMQLAVQFEDLRSSAIFEDTGLLARSARFQHANQRFMESCASFHALHAYCARMLAREQHDAYERILLLYDQLCEAVGEGPYGGREGRAMVERLQRGRAQVLSHSGVLEQQLAAQPDQARALDTASALLLRLIDELIAYAQSTDKLYNASPALFVSNVVSFSRVTDFAPALINVVRAFLAMMAVGWFWFESSWSGGENVLLNTGIYCALFASTPNPAKTTYEVGIGYAIACVAVFLFKFLVMPHIDGYGLLVATYIPFILVGFVIMVQMGRFGIGLGYCICFVYITGLANVQPYDVTQFINSALAQLFGIATAIAAYTIIPPAGRFKWVARRLQKRMDHQVQRAATSSLSGIAGRLESQNRDLFNQLMSQVQDVESSPLVERALIVCGTGRTIVELRLALEQQQTLASEIRRAVRSAIEQTVLLFRMPTAERYQRTQAAVLQAEALVSQADEAAPTLRRSVHVLAADIEHAGKRLVEDAGLGLYDSHAGQPE
ncbi:p-hydroxybenzoic acid efflux pump subunit AaeB [Carnimonas sp. R-84981]|uniref:FUSC family protein n=1 Tax=Carnimonas bestiolae TaxID=3402172 RepID=UPI003EDB6DDE